MEKTQTSRKRIMPSSIDRLSAFPDDILCHILSFLPTKTSISTSILAQRWRFLWAHVPNLNLGRGKAPKIDTIYNKVMLPYRVKKMNTFRLFSDDAKCCRSQLTSCIQDAINRNVAVLNLSLVIAYTFPSCIFNCKTLVNLKLAGHGDITLMSINDDVYLPSLKKLFLYSVGYVCEETLPYLLSRCPVLEELTVHKLEADVACFVVSSRTIKRLVLNSYFVIRYYTNNRYTVKIDAPELTYLKFHDYESKDVSCGSLTSLIEADVQLDADADDDDADDDVFDGDAPVEDDVNDVSDDDAHDNDISDDDVLNNEAPIEGDVLYARSVLEFVGGLFNVKYLKLSARWMNVSDSEFSSWTVKFNNLTTLEFGGDWRFIPIFLETADNLEVLRICMDNKYFKYWIEPNQVPTCLLSHLETVRIDDFELAEPQMHMIKYILRNAKVLKRMDIHYKCREYDLEKTLEELNLISLFERGSVECKLHFH